MSHPPDHRSGPTAGGAGTLASALQFHAAGRLADAERLYREVVAAEPTNAEAWHSWGVLAYQQGDAAAAIARTQRALELADGNPAFLSMLGLALQAESRLAEAIASLRRAAALAPRDANVLYNLANALREDQQYDDAADCYRRAIASAPDFAEAHHNLGSVLQRLGHPEKAIANFQSALALRPSSAQTHSNLGGAFKSLRRWDEAIASYHEALRLQPRLASAHRNLGAVHYLRGDHEVAADCFRRALALDPQSADALTNLALSLEAMGRRAEALECHRRAVDVNPGRTALRVNYAGALIEAGQLSDAERQLRQARGGAPNDAAVLHNLGVLRTCTDRFDEAFGHFHAAVQAEPDDLKVYRNLLPAILYAPAFDDARRFAEHRRFGRVAARVGRPKAPQLSNTPDPDRPLRVGWLSSDFRDHPVGRNLEAFFRHRDRRAVQAFCYSDAARDDERTAWFKAQCDGWRPIRGLDDAEVAALVRRDSIDILVIVAGRFDDNRPMVAVHRAAPVQVSFHDAGTLGLDAIDYVILDPFMAPRQTSERFVERPFRVPFFYVHSPLARSPPVSPPPCLTSGGITFACFGNPMKLNGDVIAVWAHVLARIPNSRLRLKYQDRYEAPDLRDRIVKAFAARGVAESRLDFAAGFNSISDHLRLYNGVDIALDTFPFNGSTTTFEALWMGVPVVAVEGAHVVARWSGSMLAKIGALDWLARSADEYVAIAARLAGNPDELGRVRAGLRARVAASPLCDGPRAARYFERALRAMWRRWCQTQRAGGGPSSTSLRLPTESARSSPPEAGSAPPSP